MAWSASYEFFKLDQHFAKPVAEREADCVKERRLYGAVMWVREHGSLLSGLEYFRR